MLLVVICVLMNGPAAFCTSDGILAPCPPYLAIEQNGARFSLQSAIVVGALRVSAGHRGWLAGQTRRSPFGRHGCTKRHWAASPTLFM